MYIFNEDKFRLKVNMYGGQGGSSGGMAGGEGMSSNSMRDDNSYSRDKELREKAAASTPTPTVAPSLSIASDWAAITSEIEKTTNPSPQDADDSGGDSTSGFTSYDADYGFDTKVNAVSAQASAERAGATNTETSYGFTEGGERGETFNWETAVKAGGAGLGLAGLPGGVLGFLGGGFLGADNGTAGMVEDTVGTNTAGSIGDSSGYEYYHLPDNDANKGAGTTTTTPTTDTTDTTVGDTSDTTEEISNLEEDYLESLRLRKQERFGYFESRQFEAGENPYIFVPTAWGEAGAGELDINTDGEDVEFIFG